MLLTHPVDLKTPRPLLVLIALFLLFPAAAQQARSADLPSVTVQGSVSDSNARPIPDARVEILEILEDATKHVVSDTQTDIDGKFLLLDVPLPPGDYRLHVSHASFQGDEKTFTVEPSTKEVELTFAFVLGPPRAARGERQVFTVMKLFYATDRQEASSATQGVSYLGVRATDGKLKLGICEVSVPEHHQIAEIERPSIWKLEFRADPEKHIVLQKVTPEPGDAFFKEVSDRVLGSDAKDAFVFIHGYNVSFEDAAERTAQLAYDLGFKGAPIFYSWPSKGSLFGYSDDEQSITLTVDNLKQFLRALAERSGAKTIHLVAHSMGNRALLPALQALELDRSFKNRTEFKHIVLAAPDVDRDTFVQLAQQIKQPDNKVTLYVSARDQALLASHKFFHKQPRAGEAGPQMIVLPGIDTIDVTQINIDILGHSYFGGNRTVLFDMLHIFEDQALPRQPLVQVTAGKLVYWLFDPKRIAIE